MPRIPQVRSLNFIREKDSKTAEAFDDLIRAHSNVSEQLATDPNGGNVVPPVIAQLLVQQLKGFVDIAIIDRSPISRAINYYLEISTSPSFGNPRTIALGPSRNYHMMLPNGTFYFRARSQYPHGGPPSNPVSAQSALVITASVIGALTLFSSQGSGTGGGGAGKTLSRK